MKKFRFFPWLFAVLIWFPLPLWAQGTQQFADRVQQVYDQAKDLRIEFVQKTYVALLEKEVSKKGEASFKKANKMAIHYEGAQGRNYLSNAKTLWIFETGDPQAQSYPLDEETMPAEALNFMGGLGQLKRDFAVEEVDPKKWANLKRDKEGLKWLELTPLQKKSSLQWIVMGFDPDSAQAREVFLYNDSGNVSHYVFNKVEFNPGLSDELFEYKKK